MIQLTVSGLFKERSTDPKAEFVRTFQRTMVIVPNNGGFCIKNEMMHINNASPSQSKNAFKTPAPVVAAPVQQITGSAIVTAAPDEATKQQMLQAIAQQTNMNADWSQKCLMETQWDFNRAVYVFGELYKQGKIPPEAFIKP